MCMCTPEIDSLICPNCPKGENTSDDVNHPTHYNSSLAKCDCGRRIECIDVTRNLNFNIGNAIKYLWRCQLKNSTIKDLKKAIWYILDEIRKIENVGKNSGK